MSTEAKHTEGPWEFHANEYHDGKKTFWVGNGEYAVFDCSPYGPKEMVFPPNLADARLICAAPDMLEVLEELDECAYYWSQYDVPVGIHDRIKSAIAKAKGEQP
jgi:hypothetical protein